jgi:hypothetical protein
MSINDFYIEEEKDSPQAGRPPVQTQPRDQSPSEVEKTFSGFFKNLTDDTVAFGKGLAYPFQEPGEFFDGMKGLVMDEQGDFDLGGLYEAGGAVVDRYKEIAADPGQSLYDQPLSTAMDIASLAFPVRGAAKLLPDGSTAQKVTEGAANVVQNMDPISAAGTSVAALNAAVTNPIDLQRTVVKPGNSRTNKSGDWDNQEQVIADALDRGVAPSAGGMRRLDDQIGHVGRQIEEVLESSEVKIPMGSVVNGFEDWAKSQLKENENNRGAIEERIASKSDEIKNQYSLDRYGDPIDYRDASYLREMRQGADGEINHNRQTQQNDSAKVRVDKLYAEYLRESLAAKVPDLKPLNAEMHKLLEIDTLYEPAYQRIAQNNPSSLTSQLAGGAALATGGYGVGTDNIPAIVAAGLATVPWIMNNPTVRNKSAGSARRSQSVLPNVPGRGAPSSLLNAGGDAVGALARDRNNVPFYFRQGGNALEGLFSEVSGEEGRD